MRPPSSVEVERVLETLGQSCGLGPLQLDEHRQLVLDLEPGNQVLLIQDLEDGSGRGLMVAVSGPCNWLRPELCFQLLQKADFRQHGTQPPRWIWNNGRLWASIRLPHAGLLAAGLEQVIHRLCGELDAVADPT
ncbi:type III secretion system chaperone [uncultured Hydrogenophaga sp.]|uniref:type III secretion system chaperone n=1 Tax=uncultured Hydrogenophaga sp. TaxID=199683 RepID=UPI00265F365D|nr:type III secretion system chaperone [uncultured Hydrogenophaga sp.]